MPARLPRFGARPTTNEARARPRRWQGRYRTHRAAFFVTILALVVLGFLANTQQERRKREQGSFVRSEQLTRDDHALKNGGRFDAWTVDLDAGQTLRAEIKTTEIVPYLSLIGPMAEESPEMVAESTKVGASIAVLEFTPSRPGEYGILVRSRGALGAYQLTTNYRATALGSTNREVEGVVDGLGIAVVIVWLAQYLGLFTLLGWRHPDRILLLRPFNERAVSHALKRFNRRTLAYRGFTFTLADKHLKNSVAAYLLANVPMDLGSLVTVLYRPLFRRMHRRVYIRKPADLAILRLRLRSRWTLTRFWQSWFGFGDRINKFRSRDELWKDCISILLDDCQVIVLDVSDAGSGTIWEIEELFRRGYLYKSVFLVRDNDEEATAARQMLEPIAGSFGIESALTPALHRYAEDGRLLDHSAFDDAYSAAVSHAQHPPDTPLPVSRKAVLAFTPLLGPLWVPVAIPLALLAIRDIRRTNGLMKGEMLAHFAIVLYGFLGGAMLLLLGIALAAR